MREGPTRQRAPQSRQDRAGRTIGGRRDTEAGPVTLHLPEPPSGNRYWRHVGARVLLSAEARAYRQAVANAALLSRVRPLAADVPCAVTLRWYRGRRAGDLDNRVKQLLDSLCGVAYADDRQVVELHAYRADDPRRPRVEVTVGPVETTWTPEKDRG